MWVWLLVGVVSGERRFVDMAYIEDPWSRYGATVLRSSPRRMAVNGFNPSIAPLPRSAEAPAGARYVGTFRSKGRACAQLLRTPRHDDTRGGGPGAAASGSKTQTRAAMLDAELRVVAPLLSKGQQGNGTTTTHDLLREDVRLRRFRKGDEDVLLATAVQFKHVGRLHKWQMFFDVLEVDLKARGGWHWDWFAHADVTFARLVDQGKNLGLLWDGDSREASRFRVFYWHRERADVRRGLPRPPPTRAVEGSRPILGYGRKPLMNNGNPVRLRSAPGLLLTVGHVHLDDAPNGRYGHYNATPHGNTYLNYFVFYADDYDHPNDDDGLLFVKRSPAFCFPSLDDDPTAGTTTKTCETIQFVMTLLPSFDDDDKNKHKNDETLLITYGVNDCDSAHVTLDVEAVLNFTFAADDSPDFQSPLLDKEAKATTTTTQRRRRRRESPSPPP